MLDVFQEQIDMYFFKMPKISQIFKFRNLNIFKKKHFYFFKNPYISLIADLRHASLSDRGQLIIFVSRKTKMSDNFRKTGRVKNKKYFLDGGMDETFENDIIDDVVANPSPIGQFPSTGALK